MKNNGLAMWKCRRQVQGVGRIVSPMFCWGKSLCMAGTFLCSVIRFEGDHVHTQAAMLCVKQWTCMLYQNRSLAWKTTHLGTSWQESCCTTTEFISLERRDKKIHRKSQLTHIVERDCWLEMSRLCKLSAAGFLRAKFSRLNQDCLISCSWWCTSVIFLVLI